MDIYKRRVHPPLKIRFKKGIETFLKSVLLLLFPLPATAGGASFWYFVLYKHSIYFGDRMEVIITAAVIPFFGIGYLLWVTVILNSVWTKYNAIRMAIKCYDLETYINLKDEEISPLEHIVAAALSTVVLAGFMGLKYPDPISGAAVAGATTYVLSLIYYVVREMDDPFGGLWYIKNIHIEWLKFDHKTLKEIRQENWEKIKEKLDGNLRKIILPGSVTIPGPVTLTVEPKK